MVIKITSEALILAILLKFLYLNKGLLPLLYKRLNVLL